MARQPFQTPTPEAAGVLSLPHLHRPQRPAAMMAPPRRVPARQASPDKRLHLHAVGGSQAASGESAAANVFQGVPKPSCSDRRRHVPTCQGQAGARWSHVSERHAPLLRRLAETSRPLASWWDTRIHTPLLTVFRMIISCHRLHRFGKKAMPSSQKPSPSDTQADDPFRRTYLSFQLHWRFLQLRYSSNLLYIPEGSCRACG